MNNSEAKYLFLVDGLSKSFAAGGLRCGFMACPDEGWAHEVQSLTMVPPDGTLRAWDSLYSVFLDEAPHNLMDVGKELAEVHDYLQSARGLLQDQRERLLAVLTRFNLCDRLDGAKRGGLFTLARLGSSGKKLATSEKILVNPPEWAHTDEWCRICFSLEPARFNAALARLTAFIEHEFSS
jgi:aspartate/methionine/tyrosine aminotransferase